MKNELGLNDKCIELIANLGAVVIPPSHMRLFMDQQKPSYWSGMYCLLEDIIVLTPLQEEPFFSNVERQIHVLLHELIHWSGHKTRTGRLTKYYTINREELTAEMGARLLNKRLGLIDDKQFSEFWEIMLAQYGGWCVNIKTVEIQAEQAVNYIMNLIHDQRNVSVTLPLLQSELAHLPTSR